MAARWLWSWGLAAVAFGGASLIVPLYIVALGADASGLGLLFASGSFVGVPGALVFGNLADRTGRRRGFVLLAMAVTVLSMAAIPALESVPLVIVANAFLWLGFAAALPVLTLLVVAGEPANRWSSLIARMNRVQGIGWVVGLGLGFVVIAGGTAELGELTAQRLFFVSCAVVAALGFGIGWVTLPPDSRAGGDAVRGRLRRSMGRAARFDLRGGAFPFTPARFDPRQLDARRFVDRFSPRLAVYFLAVVLVFTGFGVFFAPLPAYLDDAGFGTSAIFGLYLLLNLGAAVFFGTAATLADRYGVERVHVGGLLVRGVAFPLVAGVGIAFGGTLVGVGGVTALFVLVGLAWAVISVTAATLVTALAPPVIRGEALGVYGALVAVGGGLGGLVGGWLGEIGYGLTFAVAGGVVLLGAGVVGLLMLRTDGLPEAESGPL